MSVHHTHEASRLREIHAAVLDIVGLVNRPDRDELLIREAGIRLDRALFPLLVLIERLGPVGIVELGGRVGRDHSTVSRQVAKLVELGLAERERSDSDGRLRAVVATGEGKVLARRIDAARERIMRQALADWSPEAVERLGELMRRYADALEGAAKVRRSTGEGL